MGFENVSRYINMDRENLNRGFPGDPGGTMAQQIVRRLYNAIASTEPDLVIDIHNDWVRSVSYVLVDPPEVFSPAKLSQRVWNLARETGLQIVEDSDVVHPLRNTLAGALVGAGSPVTDLVITGRSSKRHYSHVADWRYYARQRSGLTAGPITTSLPRCVTSA